MNLVCLRCRRALKRYIMCFYFVLSYNYNCLLVALVLELVVLSINSMLEFMCDFFTLTSDGSVGALTSLFDSIWGIRITCGSTTNLLHQILYYTCCVMFFVGGCQSSSPTDFQGVSFGPGTTYSKFGEGQFNLIFLLPCLPQLVLVS